MHIITFSILNKLYIIIEIPSISVVFQCTDCHKGSQILPKNKKVSNIVKQLLHICDQFNHSWIITVYDSAKCINYRTLKREVQDIQLISRK